jgi:hypothetical protein
LVIINVILCIKTVPILGLVLGFFTMVITFGIFMNNPDISIFFSYLLLVISFACMIINGLDLSDKKTIRGKK